MSRRLRNCNCSRAAGDGYARPQPVGVSALKILPLLAALGFATALASVARADQPPLVDRTAFFGEVKISGA